MQKINQGESPIEMNSINNESHGSSRSRVAWNSDESERNKPNSSTFWKQYKALVIRNITLKKRERRKTITEFFMPLYFIAILAGIRAGVPVSLKPEINTPHGEADIVLPQYVMPEFGIIHIAPDNTVVREIINISLSLDPSLGLSQNLSPKYYGSEDDILDVYKKNSSDVIYAVVFPDDPLSNTSFKIRFNKNRNLPSPTEKWAQPGQCRMNGSSLEFGWTCPANKYYYSGFSGLQYILEAAFVKVYTKSDVVLPEIVLQTWPKQQWLDETASTTLRSIVPLYMVFAWGQFIVYMMMLIVEEKEKKIKEGMKQMGLRDSVYWLSWLTIYGGYVVILSTICIIILPLARVFQYTNLILLFILFMLYGFSSIVLAIMMTPFFNSAKVAGVVANLSQIVFSLLYYLQVFLGDSMDTSVYWALGLLSPCAFSLALDKVILFDFSKGGLNMSNIWEGPGLPFAGSLIMISVDIIIYLALTLYLDAVVPSEYGTKQPPWFIFKPSFWLGNKKKGFNQLVYADNESYNDGENEVNPNIEAVGSEFIGHEAVRLHNLKKSYTSRGKEPVSAVDGISLNIYESQITCILGHNGAGKTTLFNMLTGMTTPTSGSASIFGLDITDQNDLAEIRSMTGVCPQHDILFMLLTPREHLTFFAKIRGVDENEVEAEVEKILEDVDLKSKGNTRAADLSGGQKRKLSIGIALIGDPRIIFLDEPTAGVDAYSRRRLWALLKDKKKGKVILLTTHFMDEADILSERKAIVSKGKIQCCGSSLYLKNKFGLGYHLTLVIKEKASVNAVSDIVKSVIQDAEFARHYGKELSFILPANSSESFTKLFELLDKNIGDLSDNVGIEGYGVSMTTLEEVFLRLNEEENDDSLKLNIVAQQMIRNKSASGSPIHLSNTTTSSENDKPLNDTKGFAIHTVDVEPYPLQAFWALTKVRFINIFREVAAVIFLILVPLGFTIGSIALLNSQTVHKPVDEILQLTPAIYSEQEFNVLLHNETGHKLEEIEGTLADYSGGPTIYDGKYATILNSTYFTGLGAFNVKTFPTPSEVNKSVDLTLLYSDQKVHSIPILTNLVSNAVLRYANGDEPNTPQLTVYSQQLPSESISATFDFSVFYAPFLLGMPFVLVPAGFTMDLVQDREIKARNLLRLNGVGFNTYFFSYFLVLLGLYSITYIGLLISIAAFSVPSLIIQPAFACVATLYFLYMPGALLFNASFSYMFDKAETARQFYPSIASMMGMLLYTAVSLINMLMIDTNGPEISRIMHICFSFTVPFYIPFGLLYYVNNIYFICSLRDSCNDLVMADYMTTEIVVVFVATCLNIPLYYILLRIADTLKLGGSIRNALWLNELSRAKSESIENGNISNSIMDPPSHEDDDVKVERDHVAEAMNNSAKVSPVLIHDLGKTYKNGAEAKNNVCSSKKSTEFTAVKSVSFEVKSGEVFGLLGPNGAGKSTTLHILTAEESPSKGKVQICGEDVKSSLSGVFKDIGYCPQHDALWPNTTVAEHMQCYAAIRGVNPIQIEPLVNAYLDGLQIKEHEKKTAKKCSGGTKRKLSYIISMLGKPKVVLLDEPSTGMDPKSKRFLWDSILASFRGNRSAILTTHSMEEADALCARITIIVRGGLRCIGAIQHLKNKYGGGYSLELKLNKRAGVTEVESYNMENHQVESVRNRVHSLVISTFQHAHVDEEFEERIIYKIPQDDIESLASCFSMLEEAKKDQLVEEYALSQTTLEQVFLQFARQQEEEDDEERS